MVLTSPPAPQPSRPGAEHGAVDVYEETHVHGVYEAIASHFSATRHKPWPLVSSFLAAQAPGSVGLDVGCGNGKNMGVNRDVVMLGCDRSAALVALARDSWCSSRRFTGLGGSGDDQEKTVAAAGAADGSSSSSTGIIQGADVAVADSLVLPFREASADFAICIAVIHHLSTRERRVDAIRQLLRCIRRGNHHQGGGGGRGDGDGDGDGGGGRILVYVWALEQSNSRRGWDEGGEQDLLVPSKQQGDRHADKTFHRYYHLYRKGELEEEVISAGGKVIDSGYERDNWWVIAG
ncbi:hypothetical protein VMCG_04304 [Cytospora schulzeri]|uniref:Methyltransferase type 11 domain-containing protein n=1 Tax=Cytospora schulzeri TaxID=448051 RepID=A0A423WT84_9PEZI|nr:hypothetical protein VMCG_04304 [Valsa malicola]